MCHGVFMDKAILGLEWMEQAHHTAQGTLVKQTEQKSVQRYDRSDTHR